MSRLLSAIYGHVIQAALGFVSLFPIAYVGSVVHSLSFEEVVKTTKKIGFFRRRRKVVTNFRRI